MITTTNSGFGVVAPYRSCSAWRVSHPCMQTMAPDQRNDPQAEHDFDLAEKMQHLGADAGSLRQALAVQYASCMA